MPRPRSAAKDFWEIQRTQWTKSIFLIVVLVVFYFFAFGLITLAAVASVGLLSPGHSLLSPHFLLKLVAAVAGVSVLIAVFQYYDARKFGAAFILKRLGAQPPDPADRYHKQFLDTLEEMRIASGIPRVKAYILPAFAINSMALVEADKTPAVAVTEGLLADCTRDELEAVAAHEVAHIARGDAFYVTMVCSLANFFEKIRESLEPEPDEQYGLGQNFGVRRGGGAPPVLLYLAVTLSALVMRLLSTQISREREILADAAGVEFCRGPVPLARAIYKAHLKKLLIGDFSSTYSPLFIVPPDSDEESEGLLANLFSTHPPVMKRVRLLADMANKKPEEIISQVWEMKQSRLAARGVLHSYEEAMRGAQGITRGEEGHGAAATGAPEAAALGEVGATPIPEDEKIWLIRDHSGKWQGPYPMTELLCLPFFSSLIPIKNLHEHVEAPAREFPQIRVALHRLASKQPVRPSDENQCPRCHVLLADQFYEGVAIKVCPKCTGKLVNTGTMERILARREVTFSDELMRKAGDFKQKFLLNPVKTQKINDAESARLTCPNCGYKMLPRPYSYQYFVPVDKCLSCYKIWFDSDELEILQILIENA
jgi:heat shock protein HtpX